MKTWIAAIATAAVLVAASASAAPQQEPTYTDARSYASDEEIRVARRAYRQTMQGQIRPMRDQLRDQAPSWGRGAGAAAQHAAGPAR